MAIAQRENLSPSAVRVVLTRQFSLISRHQEKRVTYDSLDRESDALANGLLQRGLRKGDRVAVSLGNNTEFAVV